MSEQFNSAEELVASVKTVLTLPEVYLRVKAVVEDSDSCLSDMVNAIAMDQGITARLLKLVNSAYYHLNTRVDNIRQAVNLLGMQPVHDLVLATTLTGVFSKAQSAIDMRSFWLNSVQRGVYSRLLAKALDLPDQDRLFVDGLLSNIGHQVMGIQLPQKLLSSEMRSIQSGRPLHEVEKELLGFNYAEVSGELMGAWKMPDNITEVVRHHLNPMLAGQFQTDAAIVHLAQALTALDEDDIESPHLNLNVDDDVWALAPLTDEILLEVAEQARAEIEATSALLLVGQHAA